MHLKEYISKDLVFFIRDVDEKSAFLANLVGRVKERIDDIDDVALLDRLNAREEEISTGIGHGVAIPHATVDNLDKSLCVIAKTPRGVDFKSLDSSLVHVTFLLLSPPAATGTHLRLLARIARLVSEEKFIARMAAAGDETELMTMILEEDERHV